MPQVYNHIRSELASGGRAYIVCPLVDGSKAGDMQEVKAAQDEFARLQVPRRSVRHARLSSSTPLSGHVSADLPVAASNISFEYG